MICPNCSAHSSLSCSGHFFYGDAADLKIPIPAAGSAITLLDTLRYIKEPQRLGELGAESLLIKELSPLMRRWRKHENDTALYTPSELARLFPSYRMERIYASRFLFSVSRPGAGMLAAFAAMPSYTAVLVRR